MKFFLLLTFLILYISPVFLKADEVLNLEPWNDIAWKRLLHYSSSKSRIVSKDFFLSPNGNNDLKAEFLENYNAIINNKTDQTNIPIACKFPARALYIQQILNKQGRELKLPDCYRFEKWAKAIDAKSITLIFPSSFLNNPASMFGHTLLRLDTPNQNETTRMLSYSVNFAAHTQGENALIYAFKGIFGGYYGFFSVAPYYEKLKKYSDLESRDIWEYELNFTDEEVKLLVAHLWELREIPFYYYYFDENCSYHLLALFEAIRPSLKLTEKFFAKAIPVDTVKVLLKNNGLLNKTVYRPSNVSKIKTRIKSTEADLQKNSLTCLDKCDLSAYQENERAKIIDLAYDYLDYQRLKKKGDVSIEEKRQLGLLAERSKLNVKDQIVTDTVLNPKIDPAISHGTNRVSFYYGQRNNANFYDLEFRPAYHDLLDSLSGYQKGAGIDFLDFGLRVREDDDLILQKFKLLNIDSLSGRDLFFKPLSWHFETGFVRREFDDSDIEKLQYQTSIAFGMSKELNSLLVSVLPKLNIAISEHYYDNVDLQPGITFNILRQADQGLSFNPSFDAFFETLGSNDFNFSYKVPVSYAITKDVAIRSEFERIYQESIDSIFRVGGNFYW
jgi:hypothetical protein